MITTSFIAIAMETMGWDFQVALAMDPWLFHGHCQVFAA